MAKSERLGLPFLSAGQAQKELFHNEALLLLDAVVHACCPAAPANDPPLTPEVGFAYICGATPTGAWAGRMHNLAIYSESGWRFISPVDGLEVLDRTTGRRWAFASGSWALGVIKANEIQIGGVKVLGAQRPAIADAIGGVTIDAEARSALAQILASLRAHGIIAATG